MRTLEECAAHGDDMPDRAAKALGSTPRGDGWPAPLSSIPRPDEPWPPSSRFSPTEHHSLEDEPAHQALAGSPLAPDVSEVQVRDARWRDAQRLRLAAMLVEAIVLPDAETGPGRIAIAGLRRWIVDVAKGARSQAELLEWS